MTDAQKAVRVLFFDSYLATIKNSVGAKVFQTLFADVNGTKENVLRGGELSCASFASGVLLWFGLIREKHATVSGTVRDMKNSGWEEIPEPREGCILHWEKARTNGTENEHLGFYIGNGVAVSNSRAERTPIEHHWTYGETRKVVAMYWHPRLNS